MRVLYLCHRYLDTKIGGLSEFLHHLPLALQPLGIQSYIYTQAENKYTNQLAGPEILENNIPRYSGPFLKPALFPAKKSLQPLLQLCREQQIDLIHAQGTYRAGYMAMHIHKQAKIPYIVTSHSDILAINSERLQRRNIRHRCHKILRQAAQVTHLTSFMVDASTHLCDTQHKNTIIGNGIDYAAWRPYQDVPEQNYLLAIGRLEPEKGFHILLSAFAELIKQKKEIALIIAGTGSAEAALKTQATQLGLTISTELTNSPTLGTVVFTGYVKNKMKMKLFSAAQAVLFAPQPGCWEEAFGIVQLEAMAAGKVLIASDIPQTRYLQSQGLQVARVEADNTTQWTEQMSYFIDNPTLRHKWSTKNRKVAKQFDWNNIATQYNAIYKKATLSKSP